MNCPTCDWANPAGMNFCGKCASPLARVCPSCSFENPPEFGFCGKCATNLTEDASAGAAPPGASAPGSASPSPAESSEQVPHVMSCFTVHFTESHGYSESISNAAEYYDECAAHAEHWQCFIGDQMKIVRYESLVEDPRDQISDLLAFAGLDIEEACFHPHQLERKVVTASLLQVTQPIYQSGNERWDTYRPHLGEDLELLI